jgi:L-lactate dehydrogenase (cytochrome)
VFVGRPFLFAAVAAGEPGVQRAITLLRDEIDRDMALLGVRSVSEITADLVRRL